MIILLAGAAGACLYILIPLCRKQLLPLKQWLAAIVIFSALVLLAIQTIKASTHAEDKGKPWYSVQEAPSSIESEPTHSAIIQKLLDNDVAQMVRGQENRDRIVAVEDKMTSIQMQQVRMQTILETQHEILIGIAIGLGGLLLETLVRIVTGLSRKFKGMTEE